MSVIPIRSERASRGARMLRTALGSAIADWLDDPVVIEVMLNPDGRLWIDRLGEGIYDTGVLMAAADGERIIRLVAHHVGVEVHGSAPRVFVIGAGGAAELVNYRVSGRYMLVDRLFTEAELRIGDRKSEQRVRIRANRRRAMS